MKHEVAFANRYFLRDKCEAFYYANDSDGVQLYALSSISATVHHSASAVCAGQMVRRVVFRGIVCKHCMHLCVAAAVLMLHVPCHRAVRLGRSDMVLPCTYDPSVLPIVVLLQVHGPVLRSEISPQDAA